METHLNILTELLKYYFKTSPLNNVYEVYGYLRNKNDINDRVIQILIYDYLK
jgi:hypothetical protein